MQLFCKCVLCCQIAQLCFIFSHVVVYIKQTKGEKLPHNPSFQHPQSPHKSKHCNHNQRVNNFWGNGEVCLHWLKLANSHHSCKHIIFFPCYRCPPAYYTWLACHVVKLPCPSVLRLHLIVHLTHLYQTTPLRSCSLTVITLSDWGHQ